MFTAIDKPGPSETNGSAHPVAASASKQARKQRVTITLPLALLERLRNAVYWTGHGTLARLITDSLEDAVNQMEGMNGERFPHRLAPLKRGRPRTKLRPAFDTVSSTSPASHD